MKWVARLREVKTDNNPLLFKCKTAAGHGGSSGACTIGLLLWVPL
jgi:oligopeptidase B